MNSGTKGDISEAKIMARFLERGYIVLVPWGDNQRYDLALDLNGQLIRVQCKTGRLQNGCVVFPTRSIQYKTRKSIHYKNDAELFAAYSPDFDCVFLIPVQDVGERAVALRYGRPKKGGKYPIRWADDYRF